MNRKHLIRLVGGVTALVMLYLFSYGPVYANGVWLARQGAVLDETNYAREAAFYAPIDWLGARFGSFKTVADWWVELWLMYWSWLRRPSGVPPV